VSGSEVVEELWRRIEARDWEGAAELVADDAVIEWPHSRERLHGKNYIEVNRIYPEGWSIEVLRVLELGDVVVSEVRVPHDSSEFWVSSIFEVQDGQIVRGREYWVESPTHDVPQWRAHLVERW
jgi:ketosteroid isomerase-like protein